MSKVILDEEDEEVEEEIDNDVCVKMRKN